MNLCEGGCGVDVTKQVTGVNGTTVLYCQKCIPSYMLMFERANCSCYYLNLPKTRPNIHVANCPVDLVAKEILEESRTADYWRGYEDGVKRATNQD